MSAEASKKVQREAKRQAKAAAKAEKALAKAEKRATKKRSRKAMAIGGAIAAVALGGAYAYGANVFSKQFYPNTTIGTIDVSGKAFTEAKALVSQLDREYVADVSGEGMNFQVTPVESGMKVDAEGLVDTAQEAMNPWAWPIEVFASHEHEWAEGVTLDDNSLSAYVKNQVEAFNGAHTPSEDARIEYSPDSHSFEIIPEVYGDQIDESTTYEAVKTCLFERETECVIPADAVIQPAAKAADSDVVAGLKAANEILGVNATFTSKLKDDSVGSLGSDQVSQWIVFDEKHAPSIDDEALSAWASQLAAPLTTVGSTRSYTRPDGKQITVSGGSYGCATSHDETAKLVREAVEQKKTEAIELPQVCYGDHATEGAANEWGAYVDVDLTEQHARFYNAAGNVIWESGVISGNPNTGHGTPMGAYFVNNKVPGITLLGRFMPNGKREYETPVSYWMPFNENLVGLHDAYWQLDENFSDPTAFQREGVGSHGCINLPSSAAASLYSIITVGTPVIVHS